MYGRVRCAWSRLTKLVVGQIHLTIRPHRRRSWTVVPMLNKWLALPAPSKLPLFIGNLDPHQYVVPRAAHRSPQPRRHLDRFSRFCSAHNCNRPTDRRRYIGKK